METRKPLTLCVKLAYGVGHVLNDLCACMWFTFLLIYLQYVLQLKRRTAGLLLLLGQVADAVATPLVGLHSDSGCGHASSCCHYGRRKTWHAVGTLCVLVSFPLIFVRCAECIHYPAAYSALIAIVICVFQFGWAAVQVSHLALIPDLAATEADRDELNIIRYFFDVSSDVLVYLVAWTVFSEDVTPYSGTLDPSDDVNFMIVTVTVITVGAVLSLVFHLFTPEPSYETSTAASTRAVPASSVAAKKPKQLKSKASIDQQEALSSRNTREDEKDEQRRPKDVSKEGEAGDEEEEALGSEKDIKAAKEEVPLVNQVEHEGPADERAYLSTGDARETSTFTKPMASKIDDDDDDETAMMKQQGGERKIKSKDGEEDGEREISSVQASSRHASVGSSSLDEFDPRWAEKPDKKVNQSSACSEEEFLLDARVEMVWRDWLKEPQFYQVSMLYTSARLVSNLSNIYVPVYLQETGHTTQLIALVPLVMSLSGVVATVLLRTFRKCSGKKGSVLTAVMVGLVACLLVMFGSSAPPAAPSAAQPPTPAAQPPAPHITTGVVYLMASLWGLSSSMLMVLSLSLTADMIGRCTESSAFVYGCMSFGDKLANGLIVVVVQEIASERCTWGVPCGWFFEELLGAGLGVALLACAASGASLAVGTLGYTNKMRRVAAERGMLDTSHSPLSSSDSSELLLPTTSQLGYGAVQHTHAV